MWLLHFIKLQKIFNVRIRFFSALVIPARHWRLSYKHNYVTTEKTKWCIEMFVFKMTCFKIYCNILRMFTMTVCLISIWIITTVNYTMLQLTISSKHNISTFISDDLFAHVYSNLFIVTCTPIPSINNLRPRRVHTNKDKSYVCSQ